MSQIEDGLKNSFRTGFSYILFSEFSIWKDGIEYKRRVYRSTTGSDVVTREVPTLDLKYKKEL
jgi:hypothetical protein